MDLGYIGPQAKVLFQAIKAIINQFRVPIRIRQKILPAARFFLVIVYVCGAIDFRVLFSLLIYWY